MAKLGKISAMLLVLICLFAPWIANDKPIIAMQANDDNYRLFLPILFDYTERDFGIKAPLLGQVDYTDNALNLRAIYPLIRYAPDKVYAPKVLSKPDGEHFLGLDSHGRDVASRLIYGVRAGVFFAVAVAVGQVAIGLLVGALLGLKKELILGRVVEVLSGVPLLFLLVLFAERFWLPVLLLLFGWFYVANLTRGACLSQKRTLYVAVAMDLGASFWQVFYRHIIKNAAPLVWAQLPFLCMANFGILTSLGYLNVQNDDLGALLLDGKTHLKAHLIIAPCVVMVWVLAQFLWLKGQVQKYVAS